MHCFECINFIVISLYFYINTSKRVRKCAEGIICSFSGNKSSERKQKKDSKCISWKSYEGKEGMNEIET